MTAGLYTSACEQLSIVMSALPASLYIEEVKLYKPKAKPLYNKKTPLPVTHAHSLSIYYPVFFWVIKKIKVHSKGGVHAVIITVARSGLGTVSSSVIHSRITTITVT